MATWSTTDFRQALRIASELREAVWQCWAYSADDDALAICAWPDRYLVFRQPRVVTLPFYLRRAEFRAVQEDSAYWVLIHAEGKEYRVVCGGGAFYQTEPHVPIRQIWNEEL